MKLFTLKYNGKIVNIWGLPGDHIFETIRKTQRFYEDKMLKKIESIKNLETIIDVGANIGNHALFMSLFTDAKKIIAVEPHNAVLPLLNKNIQSNKLKNKIVVVPKAIDQKIGQVAIKSSSPSNLGMTKTTKGTGTESTTIDEICCNENVSIIKIDIEGNELRALKGAKNTLSRCKPQLFVEASTVFKLNKLENFLHDYGYNVVGKYNWTDTYHFVSTN